MQCSFPKHNSSICYSYMFSLHLCAHSYNVRTPVQTCIFHDRQIVYKLNAVHSTLVMSNVTLLHHVYIIFFIFLSLFKPDGKLNFFHIQKFNQCIVYANESFSRNNQHDNPIGVLEDFVT